MKFEKVLWGFAGPEYGDFEIHKYEDKVAGKLEFSVKNGFRSVSIPLDYLNDPEKREKAGAFVEKHDMKLITGCGPGFFKDPIDVTQKRIDEFLSTLKKYKDIIRVPLVTTGAGTHRFMREPSLEKQLEVLTKGLTPLAKGCEEMGIRVAIENHGNYYCSDLVKLCKNVSNLGILLDTGNTYLIGEQSIRACEDAAPYVFGTHLKDHIVYPDHKTLTFNLKGAVLGEGDVGIKQVLEILFKKAPKPEELVLHWEMIVPKDMNALEALKKSWENIKKFDIWEE
jgi:sugar phosphate isomerase/epimerase